MSLSRAGAFGAPTRVLLFQRTNPWLAGRPTVPLFFRGQTRVLQFTATRPLQFSATQPKLDFVTPYIWSFMPGGTLGPLNIFQAVFVAGQWLIGQSYHIIPWIVIMFLVIFLACYGCRLGDYDRGYLLNYNFDGVHDVQNYKVGKIKNDMAAWKYIIDHWLHVTPEDAKTDKSWDVAADGSVEPNSNLVNGGGQAAFHLLNSTSLRHELIQNTQDWNDSWCRTSHLLLFQPTWIIGAGKDVHDRPRTFVGDWTEEMFPWSRSVNTFALPVSLSTS
eukprot:TRINITY_DN5096_c0_g1_i1.p1 TRINITY_DN5096_c0_g1~~TRINITY_DN5096_c0_g1_i1.p1  ORF type:complete len:275 (+),score=96.28 TRINITY_DN5096_c0_g1_i1:58-882(+)